MTAFLPGEIVDITIRNARVARYERRGDEPSQFVFTEPSGGDEITILYPRREAEVTRVAPPEWPPQPGDLWRDRYGYPHFAVAYVPDDDDREDAEGIDSDGVRVVLVFQNADESCRPGASFYRPEHVNQRCGPMTLIHRERCAMCGKPRSDWDTTDRLCRPDSRDCPTCVRKVCAEEAAMIRRADV